MVKQKNQTEKGTILITVTIIVFIIAVMSGFVMERTRLNVKDHKEKKRISQSHHAARSAMSLVIADLNKNLLDTYPDPGTLPPLTYTSADPDGRQIMNSTGKTLLGHPGRDGMDNDNDGTIDETGEDNPLENPSDPVSGPGYKGGIYRVTLKEWTTKSSGDKIGAPGIDDDDDGEVDELGEVRGYTREHDRRFTMHTVASYGNYTTETVARLHTDLSPDSPLVNFGLFSNNSLMVKPGKKGGPMDSYNSNDGSYASHVSGGYANENFAIGSNDDLTVQNPNDIHGEGKYGPDAGDEKDIKGNVSKGVSKLKEEEEYPKAEFPDTGLSTGNLNVTGTQTLTSGDYHFDNINAANSSTLKVEGPARIVVDDTFSGGDEFTLDADTSSGPVDIYVRQEVDMGPKVSITHNDPNDAAKDLKMFVGEKGGPDGQFNVQPMWDMKGLLWAPEAEAQFKPKGSDGGELHGAAIAGNVTKMQPNLSVHYDEALRDVRNLPGQRFVAYITASWVSGQRGGR